MNSVITPKITGEPRVASVAVAEKRSDQVQALSRALAILKVLSGHEEGAKLTEVARAVGLAASTTHRLLTTLQRDRFVNFDGETSHWCVGVQSFIVGNAFRHAREDLVRLARPYLRRLVDLTGETANLAVEDDGMAVYLAQAESRQTMRAIVKTGGRVFMHSSALGKAMLAARPSSFTGQVILQHGLKSFTDKSVVDDAALLAELAQVRIRQFAIDDEEYNLGLRCVAAAIHDHDGYAVAALSISGPTVRLTQARVAELGAIVAKMAAVLSAEIGGHAPLP